MPFKKKDMTAPQTDVANIDYGQKILTVNADGDMVFATRIDFTAPGDIGGTAFNWGGHYTNLIRGNTQVTGKFDSTGGAIQLRDKVTMSKDATIHGKLLIHNKLDVSKGFFAMDKVHTDGYIQLGTGQGTRINQAELKTIKNKAIGGDGLDGLCCFSNRAKGKQLGNETINQCFPPGEYYVDKMGLNDGGGIKWGKCGNGVHAVLGNVSVDRNDAKTTPLKAGEEIARKDGEHYVQFIRVREKHNPLNTTPFT